MHSSSRHNNLTHNVISSARVCLYLFPTHLEFMQCPIALFPSIFFSLTHTQTHTHFSDKGDATPLSVAAINLQNICTYVGDCVSRTQDRHESRGHIITHT